MDEFVNKLDPAKFRHTNYPWNLLMLNDPWSVGYTTSLIELKIFQNKEEWEGFYYEMGAVRDRRLNTMTKEERAILEDEQLIRTDKAKVNGLTWDLKNINTQNGRTKDQLSKKGAILFENVKDKIKGISLDECVEAVRFRVICETWNGIIVRERNTVQNLENIFKGIDFKKVDGAFDYNYAVDYELYKHKNLICGIQIKPESYTRNTPYLRRAQNANRSKNAEYFNKFGKQVFDVISKPEGDIINNQILDNIKELIK